MITLLIVADDFTGALDTGVQLAGCGAPTRVVTDPDFSPANAAGAEVLVIDAETRHLPPSQAGAIVEGIVRRAVEQKVPYIYKKTDSALRGNIGPMMQAALDASGADFAAFAPALPQMGRVTRGGVHYVGQQPITESVFGRDPFEPVRSPRLADLFAGCPAGVQLYAPGQALRPAAGGPAIGMYAQLAHWDKDRTRGNISLYFLGLSLPLVLMQYLAGYYTGPVLQGLIPCLLGCGVGLVISYPLARKIGEASFQRLLAIVIGLSGFSILTRALLDS